jgi:radical SAM protein with 4Fe4S-binding SPASM domain
VGEIVGILGEKFENTPPELFSDVVSFLDEALQKGYICYSDTPTEVQGLIQGGLTYYTPAQVLIEATAACNLTCGHCLLSAGEQLPDELTASEFIVLLERLYDLGVKSVHLSGGEILTKEGWDTIADYCTERFQSSILTNGILITEKIADKMIDYQEVHISLYGKDAETHEKVSGVAGSFVRAVNGIELLTQRGIHVGASVLMVPWNLYQLEEIVRLASSLKCAVVRVGVVTPVGRAHCGGWELTEEHKRWLDRKMGELTEQYKDKIDLQWEEEPGNKHKCGAGYSRWVITSDGDVYPCGIFRVLIGNVVEEDPVSILTSPAMRFLQDVKTPHSALCGDCQYLYLCKECHAQGAAHHCKVDHCGWAEQFETAPEPLKELILNMKKKK